MRTLTEIIAGLAILANAVIYGTDVFGATVQRPAIAAVDDRTLTQVMGHIHRVADRRLAAISIGGLIAAAVTAALAAATGHWVSTAAGALAALALITFAAVYTRISKPVNTGADRSGSRRPSARQRPRTPSPLGLGHQRARRAANPLTRRTMRRTRRSPTPQREPQPAGHTRLVPVDGVRRDMLS
jgi:hypothetical protein